MSATSKRFRVALSFPGEKRTFVKKVAAALVAVLGRDRVLYDDYLTAELARPNLDVYLGQLYHQESDLLVPFFCADYERKEWCGLEWRQIRDLLKRKMDEQIMPFRFDDASITGVLSIDGYIKVGQRSPQQVAKLILERSDNLDKGVASPRGEATGRVKSSPSTSAAAVAAPLPSQSQLGTDAQTLLLAMAEAENGSLLHSTTHSGYGITVGKREFLADTMNQRTRARWMRAIRDLLERELIEEDGPSGEILVLTDSGYAAADGSQAINKKGESLVAFEPIAMPNVPQFFREAGQLIPEGPFGEGPVEVTIPVNPAVWLRVWPAREVESLRSELAAKQLATKGDLRPMGLELGGRDWSRNEMGAIVYAAGHDAKLRNFTELFSTTEICGVDLRVVQRVRRNTAKGEVLQPLLMIYRAELSCALAAANFVKFSRQSLGHDGPCHRPGENQPRRAGSKPATLKVVWS